MAPAFIRWGGGLLVGGIVVFGGGAARPAAAAPPVPLLTPAAAPAPAVERRAPSAHLLVVTGAPGEPRFAEAFESSADAIARAAAGPLGLPKANVHRLAGAPASARAGVARATRDAVRAAVARLASASAAGDVVTIVLIGHGSAREGASLFNLPGPDVTAAEFAGWLAPLRDRQLAVLVAASASGDWVSALAAPGRVVISATRGPHERNESRFHIHLAVALANDAADTDKDGRVSLLELFRYASGETAREYERDGRLRTEHALLDDDGDGRGSGEPAAAAQGDGALAARRFLAPVVATRVAAQPGADSLLRERARVEEALAALRARRGELDAAEYDRELEALVTRLALIRRRLEGGGQRP